METLDSFIAPLNKAQTPEGESAFQALASDPDALHNPKRAAVDLKHEKAEHRVIVMLKAQGFSNMEIATQLGFTPVMVNYVVNQPWAQKRIVEEIQRAGRDEVETVLRGAVLDSVNTLISLRDNPGVKASDKRAISEYLIDRILGKPKQAIDHNLQGRLTDLSDAELAAIATGGNTSTAST